VFFTGVGCGKQLNADFCDAHPEDDRCLGGTGDGSTVDASACPSTYAVTFAGTASRYRIIDDEISWSAAQTDCGDDGTTTHLIVLNGDAERQALAPHTTSLERHVGYSDKVTEGTWIPVTDDPAIYAALVALDRPPWNSGEPNEGTSGNCLAISNGLVLHDRSCDGQPAAYVCECDSFAPNPANF
jgi:hypothetical protein